MSRHLHLYWVRGGTALLHRHLPAVSFFTTTHYTDTEETIDHD